MRTPIALLLLAALSPALAAQGRIVRPTPPGPRLIRPVATNPVRVSQVAVTAAVRDGGVTTEVKVLFRNQGRGQGEADLLIPLPPGAVVHQSRLLVNGKEMPSETLDAGRAKAIYREIVSRRRDPLLLEYAGWGLVRARIFPVPAGGTAQARFFMTGILPEAGGVREFRFPFKALGAPQGTPLSATVEIKLSKALGAVYSPTSGAEVRRKDEHTTVVGWEGKGTPAHDLQLFYAPAEKNYGALALFHRGRAAQGTFMLSLRPRQDAADMEEIPKTVVFVVDTSGSMQGRKIEQVKGALRFFIKSLRQGDAFNIIPFSTEARQLFPAPREVTPASRGLGLDLVDKIEATGGTNIQDALLKGLALPKDGRLPILVFLTDGLPTVGETNASQILKRAKAANGKRCRLFVFGAGHDVDTFLLDRLARDGRGDRHYVLENESIEVKVSSLLTRLSRPALSNLKLRIQGATISKLTPSVLPDLFHGQSLTVLGRYTGSGPGHILVEGTVRGKKRTWEFPVTLPAAASGEAWLEPLWAQRRVAHLIDMIKLYGRSKELVDEVIRLGKEHGIVTPWTSHLIVEESERLSRASGLRSNVRPPQSSPTADSGGYGLLKGGGGRRKGHAPDPTTPMGPSTPAAPATPSAPSPGPAAPGNARGATTRGTPVPVRPRSGKNAVADSKKLREMQRAERLDDEDKSGDKALVRRVAGKVFVKLQKTWVDREFKESMRGGLKKIKAFSAEYFDLLTKHKQAAKWLAKGGRIIVVIDGQAWLIEG